MSSPEDPRPAPSVAGNAAAPVVEAAAPVLDVSAPSAAQAPPLGSVHEPSAEERFQREKACYEQNCNSFRSLNQLMWQVPLIAMTLTGGLWYGVANPTVPKLARVGLLALACFANFGLGALVLPRVRNVMGAHLAKMKGFYEAGNPTPEPLNLPILGNAWIFGDDRGTMRVYSGLLLAASVMSASAALLVAFGAMAPPSAVAPPSLPSATMVNASGIGSIDAGQAKSYISDAGSIGASGNDASVDDAAKGVVDAPLSDAPVTLDAWTARPDSTMAPNNVSGSAAQVPVAP